MRNHITTMDQKTLGEILKANPDKTYAGIVCIDDAKETKIAIRPILDTAAYFKIASAQYDFCELDLNCEYKKEYVDKDFFQLGIDRKKKKNIKPDQYTNLLQTDQNNKHVAAITIDRVGGQFRFTSAHERVLEQSGITQVSESYKAEKARWKFFNVTYSSDSGQFTFDFTSPKSTQTLNEGFAQLDPVQLTALENNLKLTLQSAVQVCVAEKEAEVESKSDESAREDVAVAMTLASTTPVATHIATPNTETGQKETVADRIQKKINESKAAKGSMLNDMQTTLVKRKARSETPSVTINEVSSSIVNAAPLSHVAESVSVSPQSPINNQAQTPIASETPPAMSEGQPLLNTLSERRPRVAADRKKPKIKFNSDNLIPSTSAKPALTNVISNTEAVSLPVNASPSLVVEQKNPDAKKRKKRKPRNDGKQPTPLSNTDSNSTKPADSKSSESSITLPVASTTQKSMNFLIGPVAKPKKAVSFSFNPLVPHLVPMLYRFNQSFNYTRFCVGRIYTIKEFVSLFKSPININRPAQNSCSQLTSPLLQINYDTSSSVAKRTNGKKRTAAITKHKPATLNSDASFSTLTTTTNTNTNTTKSDSVTESQGLSFIDTVQNGPYHAVEDSLLAIPINTAPATTTTTAAVTTTTATTTAATTATIMNAVDLTTTDRKSESTIVADKKMRHIIYFLPEETSPITLAQLKDKLKNRNLTVKQRNALFIRFKKSLEDRNISCFTSCFNFFAGANTAEFINEVETIRRDALARLETEIKNIQKLETTSDNIKQAIITFLKEIREMEIFNDHRNNHWYTGAFGRTTAVQKIDLLIADHGGETKLIDQIRCRV